MGCSSLTSISDCVVVIVIMNPETSIQIVMAYLKSAFPDGELSHKPHFDSRAEDFEVYHAGTRYRLRASHDFLTELAEPEIEHRLTEWGIATHMRVSADKFADLRRDGVITAIPHESSL